MPLYNRSGKAERPSLELGTRAGRHARCDRAHARKERGSRSDHNHHADHPLRKPQLPTVGSQHDVL